MPLALILSSHVAGSRVGGFPQALVLARFGVDPVFIPTVMFGRRPGLDTPPGGGAVPPELFRGMLEGARAHGLYGLADAVVTGYFASAEQVAAAAEAIDRVRAASRAGAFNPRPLIVVDPVMGDDPDGLYVRPEVAEAVEVLLLPRADVLTPNVWELRRLTGAAGGDPAALARAARTLDRPVLVTSVDAGPDRIGALHVDGAEALLFSHPRRPETPNGTGDLVAAVLAARLVQGASAAEASEAAIRAVAEAADAAAAWGAPELPLVALADRLAAPLTADVRVQRLDAAEPRGA
jgi:pyridoxine kinase